MDTYNLVGDELLESLIRLADALARMPDIPDEKTGHDFYAPLKRVASEILAQVEPERIRAATPHLPDEFRHDYRTQPSSRS